MKYDAILAPLTMGKLFFMERMVMNPFRRKGITVTILAFLALAPVVEALNTHSMDLNGTTQSLLITDGDQIGLDLVGNLTVEAWVKLESVPSNDSMVIVSKYKAGSVGDRGYYLAYEDSSGTKKLAFTATDDGGDDSNVWGSTHHLQTFSVNYTLGIGTWYHVAATYTTTGTVDMFVNGISIGTATGGLTSVHNNAATFAIGGLQTTSGLGSYFDGKIDDVRVWNVARTQAEIATNMNKELVGNEPGLVGYWKFNGSSLEDATANNNDLTNNGSATFSTDIPFLDAAAPTLSFAAAPATIQNGQSSTLTWSAQNAVSCAASGAWSGSKVLAGSEVVTPSSSAVYSLDCTGPGGDIHKEVNVTVNAAPPAPSGSSAVRKPANESVTKSATLQNDDALKLALVAGKTYVVDGVIFVSAGKNIPDLRIAFAAPNGSDMVIGYITDAVLQNGSGVLTQSNASSRRIQVPASTSIPIAIKGTIVAGTAGDLQLKWAQFTSSTNSVTVTKGSYLAIREI